MCSSLRFALCLYLLLYSLLESATLSVPKAYVSEVPADTVGRCIYNRPFCRETVARTTSMVTTVIRTEREWTYSCQQIQTNREKHVHQIYPSRHVWELSLPGHLRQSLQILKVLVYSVWSSYFYSSSEWSLLTATCHYMCHHHHYPCVSRPLVSAFIGHTHSQPLIMFVYCRNDI